MAKQIIIEGGEQFDLFLTALRAVHGAVSSDDEMFRDYFKQWVCGVIDMYRVGTAISDAEDEIGIEITGTSNYFVIRNCTIYNCINGIQIEDVEPGTGEIYDAFFPTFS